MTRIFYTLISENKRYILFRDIDYNVNRGDIIIEKFGAVTLYLCANGVPYINIKTLNREILGSSENFYSTPSLEVPEPNTKGILENMEYRKTLLLENGWQEFDIKNYQTLTIPVSNLI